MYEEVEVDTGGRGDEEGDAANICMQASQTGFHVTTELYALKGSKFLSLK
jgi:hypothetical protein